MIVQASLKVLPNTYNTRELNYKLVDEALIKIKNSKLQYKIGPSETTVQGERNIILELIKNIQDYYYDNEIEFLFFITFEYNKENFYIDKKQINIDNI